MLIKVFAFIYFLVAIRVFLFQGRMILNSHKRRKKDKPDKAIDEDITLARRMTMRAILAVILWPLDFLVVPTTMFKAYIFLDSRSMFELGYYYGRTSFFHF